MNDRRFRWSVRLTEAAESDLESIIHWTAEHFDRQQALVYSNTLSASLQDLMSGPDQGGVRIRHEIARGIRTLHVARKRRKGRHYVLFRVAEGEERVIEVLRILHDSMDLQRHWPPAGELD